MSGSGKTIHHVAPLIEAGLVAQEQRTALEAISARYALAISPAMFARITSADDPVGRQFVPDIREAITTPEERADPIGDHAHSPIKGIVHRYPDRVLIKITHSCPVYCRFCFRREMVGPAGDGNLTKVELDAAFAYITAHPEICEVIFTGGDPLMLSPRRISALGHRLEKIAHVRLVRWHSRVPVVAPERITKALVHALGFANKANYIAIHANHAREFGPEAPGAIARLADAGLVLLGQSVLLRGINDNPETLIDLFRLMAANRIVPLYLHHPDLAPGTAHFRLSIAEGQAIYGALRGRLSGHAIPAYVLDLPGGHGKVPVGPGHVRKTGEGIEIRDLAGRWHRYPG